MHVLAGDSQTGELGKQTLSLTDGCSLSCLD